VYELLGRMGTLQKRRRRRRRRWLGGVV